MEKQRHQTFFIRGGEAFDTKEQFFAYLQNKPLNPRDLKEKRPSWRDWVTGALSADFESFEPIMPNKQWATYQAWKIWFERYLPYLNNQHTVLIGQSLGSLFLLKYLSEEQFPKRIAQLHLVSPVITSEGLVGETVGDFLLDQTRMVQVSSQVDTVFIYASVDDPVVPLAQARQLAVLLPSAYFLQFTDRGHFDQATFPELLANVQSIQDV